jgi:hypothetical protein
VLAKISHQAKAPDERVLPREGLNYTPGPVAAPVFDKDDLERETGLGQGLLNSQEQTR